MVGVMPTLADSCVAPAYYLPSVVNVIGAARSASAKRAKIRDRPFYVCTCRYTQSHGNGEHEGFEFGVFRERVHGCRYG